jgi:hypothetical protein
MSDRQHSGAPIPHLRPRPPSPIASNERGDRSRRRTCRGLEKSGVGDHRGLGNLYPCKGKETVVVAHPWPLPRPSIPSRPPSHRRPFISLSRYARLVYRESLSRGLAPLARAVRILLLIGPREGMRRPLRRPLGKLLASRVKLRGYATTGLRGYGYLVCHVRDEADRTRDRF